MDRKAWIVIILCVAGMVINGWYASKNQETARRQAEARRTEEASKQAAVPTLKTTAEAAPAPAKPAPPPAAVPEETHELRSGNVTFQFTNHGGGIARAVLSGHDQVVLNDHGPEAIGALRREATARDATPYRIIAKDDRKVVFQGTTADGVEVTKTYQLTEGEKADEHLLSLTVNLRNTGAAQHKSEEYYLYAGAAVSLRPDDSISPPAAIWNDAGNFHQHAVTKFAGGWFSEEKTEFRTASEKLRWAGVMSRFYAHILSTPDGKDAAGKLWSTRFLVDHSADEFKDLSAAKNDHGIQAAVSLPAVDLAPGASLSQDYEIYLGPREYHRLRDIGRQRWYSMDYGMFSYICRFFINLLRWLHDHTNSWGIAIILLTIIVRTMVWPIMAKSQRSMKRMSKLQPLMKEIQEKYKDDQQKQSAEMMKLYKDYGINPVGGCLPIFIQIPIFFGCLYMLQPAAELRGQSFLWVKDLTLPDTVAHLPWIGWAVNPLPLLMGLTGFLQMKMMPQSPGMDKLQQRIFMFMPLFFVFIVYSFASGLALYYTVQNLFSIFQTWVTKVTKGPEEDAPLKKVERVPKGPPPATPFFNPMGHKKKDKKNRPPRLGG